MMEEFMMIFIGGDYAKAELSPDEFQCKMEKWKSWIEELRSQDLFINGKALQSAGSKTVIDDSQLTTDGPFVETNEIVTGYFLLKANDLDHAISLTKNYPDFDLGGKVEIRPIAKF